MAIAAPLTTEKSTEMSRTKQPEAPDRAHELHPRSVSTVGPSAAAGIGGGMSALGLGSPRWSQLASLQSTHGNQAVLNMLHPARPVTGILQRQCACGGTPGPGGECAACRAKR